MSHLLLVSWWLCWIYMEIVLLKDINLCFYIYVVDPALHTLTFLLGTSSPCTPHISTFLFHKPSHASPYPAFVYTHCQLSMLQSFPCAPLYVPIQTASYSHCTNCKLFPCPPLYRPIQSFSHSHVHPYISLYKLPTITMCTPISPYTNIQPFPCPPLYRPIQTFSYSHVHRYICLYKLPAILVDIR